MGERMDIIFAGIVLYNPEMNQLIENIEHIIHQVDVVLLVDNGSKNADEIKKLLDSYENVRYIDLHENKGIAYALNVIAGEAEKANAKWVITLDQDTVCENDIIERYKPYLYLEKVGQLTCNYRDRNFKDISKKADMDKQVEEVTWCITSAALLNIEAWKNAGGFDETLFIDEVDYDICLTMREKGYRIYNVNFIGFTHEIGNGKTIKLGLLEMKTWNHSPMRRYYGVRNAVIVARKHKELNFYRAILGAIKHMIIIFIFENQKWEKLKAGLQGLHDGIREKVLE